MEQFLKHWILLCAGLVELSAGVIVTAAALEGALRAAVVFVKRTGAAETEDIRLGVGRWLALALEFELGADILETMVSPSWSDIGKLGAIIVLRTTLNYFLQREIRTATESRERASISG